MEFTKSKNVVAGAGFGHLGFRTTRLPDQRVAGLPHRLLAGLPYQRVAGLPDRRVAGFPINSV